MTVVDLAKLLAQLRLHEGTGPVKNGRFLIYKDTVGKWTIGYGRNLTDRGISQSEADLFLTSDVMDHITRLIGAIDNPVLWESLDEVRQRVLADMAYNMGPDFIRKWPIFKGQLARHDFQGAADNMRKTAWARQVGLEPGQRAWRLIRMMETGKDQKPMTRQGRSPRRRKR